MKSTDSSLNNEAKRRAIIYLRHFISLLNVDLDLYNFIFDIDINYDDFNYADLAYYDVESNIIFINNYYYLDMCHKYKTLTSDEEKEKCINNLTITIIHEMIHAIRTMASYNCVDIVNLSRKYEEEVSKYVFKKRGYDVNKLHILLSDVLNNKESILPNKYIALAYKKYEDGLYTVIAYNRLTKCYEEFSRQKFNTELVNDENIFLYNIGVELSNEKPRKPTFNVNSYSKYLNPVVCVPCDLYSYYDDGGFVNACDIKENDSLEVYLKVAEKKFKLIQKSLFNARGFEEIMTELLSIMVYYSKDDSSLNLDSLIDKVLNMDRQFGIKMGAVLVKNMGADLITWFFTSSFSSHYNNYVKSYFRDDYNILLNIFNSLYDDDKTDRFANLETIVKFTKIIDKNRDRFILTKGK